MAGKGVVIVREDWCKGCNICAVVCPTKVLELDRVKAVMKVVAPEKCIACKQCEMVCPDFCIYVFTEEEYKEIASA